jgi:hypothetical protein
MNGWPLAVAAIALVAWLAYVPDAGRAAQPPRKEPAVPKDPPVKKISEIAARMEWVGPAVSEPDYYIWCTSPIAGADGKIHLYVSRWPKQYKMDGWWTHCEEAHYVGEKPEGAFAFHDVAIPAKPDAPWNNAIHNPAITRVGDTYYLLYISFDRRPSGSSKQGSGAMWIGMAKAAAPDGPWTILTETKPLFSPSEDPAHWSHGDTQCTNPTFLAWKGKYYIFYHGGKRISGRPCYPYAYAVADAPEGPYRIGDRWCVD